MAVSDPLASVADYAQVYPNANSDNQTELLSQLTAVSRYIEFMCGQQFTKDAAAVARVYRPTRASSQLWLGENLSTTPTLLQLDTDGDGTYATTISSSDYELWPTNAALGAEAKPYRRIDLAEWGTYTSFTASQRVKVTAVWGWASVPVAVRQACIQLTAILRIESPRATSSIDELGRVIGMSPQARGIVDDLLSAYPRLPL